MFDYMVGGLGPKRFLECIVFEWSLYKFDWIEIFPLPFVFMQQTLSFQVLPQILKTTVFNHSTGGGRSDSGSDVLRSTSSTNMANMTQSMYSTSSSSRHQGKDYSIKWMSESKLRPGYNF